jgi:hypothetical protein
VVDDLADAQVMALRVPRAGALPFLGREAENDPGERRAAHCDQRGGEPCPPRTLRSRPPPHEDPGAEWQEQEREQCRLLGQQPDRDRRGQRHAGPDPRVLAQFDHEQAGKRNRRDGKRVGDPYRRVDDKRRHERRHECADRCRPRTKPLRDARHGGDGDRAGGDRDEPDRGDRRDPDPDFTGRQPALQDSVVVGDGNERVRPRRVVHEHVRLGANSASS